LSRYRPALLLPALLLISVLAGCQQQGAPAVAPSPRYVVGAPYQAGGVWRYPREQFTTTDTGLASVTTRGPGLTADGEAFDPTALAASHRTLQLPALARVTNLETGLAVLVRLNDRGPDSPARLIAVTPRTAALLGATGDAPFRVRVQVMETESRQLAGGMATAAPLQVAAAPRDTVQQESLAPPAGATQAGRVRIAAAGPAVAAAAPGAEPAAVPLRLPEQVWRSPPAPGALYVECGSFARPQYAALMQARLAGLGARVSADANAPRDAAWRVRVGPLPDTAAAERALDQALRAGVSDARIVVDDR
jgi:rare lipoprotein A